MMSHSPSGELLIYRPRQQEQTLQIVFSFTLRNTIILKKNSQFWDFAYDICNVGKEMDELKICFFLQISFLIFRFLTQTLFTNSLSLSVQLEIFLVPIISCGKLTLKN